VNLAYESERKGKTARDATKAVLHSSYAARDLLDIINRNRGRGIILKK
jgi:hypothetical protein